MDGVSMGAAKVPQLVESKVVGDKAPRQPQGGGRKSRPEPMVELSLCSVEAELAYVCGKLPADGYRMNTVTGEVTVLVPERDLEDMLGMKQTFGDALDAA
ncbi:hypothetical protein [Streptomyces rimosus]|uniref:hypothetical protein n=1 Tax=Streptomyces rimosus TaxID=1927 RepID=UPI0004C7CDB6|nr:hypothetical protein [Streptomyces rimosus]